MCRRTDKFPKKSHKNCGTVSQISHPLTSFSFVFEPRRKYIEERGRQLKETIRTG